MIARIRAARGYANLSQPGLAKALGLSTQTVKRMESGERPVRSMELRQIGEVCRVPREFMEGGWSAITAIHHGTDNLSERMQSLSEELRERMERLERELSEALLQRAAGAVGHEAEQPGRSSAGPSAPDQADQAPPGQQ
jgi:transcriptional regulator with XRE-family HTH domain